MAKRTQEDPLAELEKSYAHWQALYDHGGSDPTWSDGVNLNLVRNHIYYYKRQIEETCPLYMSHELYQRPLPPEVDKGYMAQADEIREHAKQSLQACWLRRLLQRSMTSMTGMDSAPVIHRPRNHHQMDSGNHWRITPSSVHKRGTGNPPLTSKCAAAYRCVYLLSVADVRSPGS